MRFVTGEVPPEEPEQATQHATLRVMAAEDEIAAPVRSLTHVVGAKSGDASSLLVLGGQPIDEPDKLHLLHLEPATDGVGAVPQACRIYWYSKIICMAWNTLDQPTFLSIHQD